MKVKHTKNGNVKLVMDLHTASVLRGVLLDTFRSHVRAVHGLSDEDARVLWDLEDHLDYAEIPAPWSDI